MRDVPAHYEIWTYSQSTSGVHVEVLQNLMVCQAPVALTLLNRLVHISEQDVSSLAAHSQWHVTDWNVR